MTTSPTWSPVGSDTASLLDLIANDQMTTQADREWQHFAWALGESFRQDVGVINPNTLRKLVRGHVSPKRIGAFTNRAKAEGLIVDTGEWVVSDDHDGRNAGRPCRVYRLVA